MGVGLKPPSAMRWELLLLCGALGCAGAAAAAAESSCPAPCRCLGDLLDCSRRGLVRMPEPLPRGVARL